MAICVGMQALMERSEENDGVECLALIPEVRYFGEQHRDANGEYQSPHMGWNEVSPCESHPARYSAAFAFYFGTLPWCRATRP